MSKYLYQDLNEDTVLWRYMSLVKFLDLISTKKLTLCRMDNFEDKFEGNSKQILEQIEKILIGAGMGAHILPDFTDPYEEVKLKSYALCMHANENESAAMWKLYGNNGETIALKTTVGKLKRSLSNSNNLHFGATIYGITDEKIEEFYKKDREENQVISLSPLEPLFLKRPSFSHENEYRVIYSDEKTFFTSTTAGENIQKLKENQSLINKIDCDVDGLIDELIIYPEASSWVVAAINATIKSFGYNFEAKKSNLYDLI